MMVARAAVMAGPPASAAVVSRLEAGSAGSRGHLSFPPVQDDWAALTGPRHCVVAEPALTRPGQADDWGMIRVRLERHPLYATAGLMWSGDLPRQLQQVLFDTADSIPL